LKNILEPVNLGVVPALWEDNLPQVAIEFVAYGVPILTSNMGGAQEISGNPEFTFDVNERGSLENKIFSVLYGDLSVGGFWDGSINIYSNFKHMEEVVRVYMRILDKYRD
jgi:glycosyltransferase involved in cell wall biosynthesis